MEKEGLLGKQMTKTEVMDELLEELVAAIQSHKKVPVFYSEKYNIWGFGLEKLHPFDTTKYMRTHRFLVDYGILEPSKVIEPPEVTDEQLRSVHTDSYLSKIRWSFYLTFIVDVLCLMCVPNVLVDRQLLKPMRYATGGTILATQIAMHTGWAINLGGGYHHASAESGGGFCVYADITIAIRELWRKNPERKLKVMIVDLDAHQGNGHERDFMFEKDKVFIFDMYCTPNFPNDREAKKGISASIPLSLKTPDAVYLKLLRKQLPECLDKFQPDLLFYNAGTDCLVGDGIGGLAVTRRGIIKRDEIVFAHAFGRSIPIVMVLSGGYQKCNAEVIAESILNLHQKFGILTDGEITPRDLNTEDYTLSDDKKKYTQITAEESD